MKILIEGAKYATSDVAFTQADDFHLFDKTYENHQLSTTRVGYICLDNQPIFVLPKLFVENDTIRQVAYRHADKTAVFSLQQLPEHYQKSIEQLLFYYFRSLKEFKKRKPETTILITRQLAQVSQQQKNNSQFLIELVFDFLAFQRKYKDVVLFTHIKLNADKHHKVNWAKTTAKSTPILINSTMPIYQQKSIKKKKIDVEEELITLFYSILWHFKERFELPIKIDSSYKIYKGNKFTRVINKAPNTLKRIKNRYFSDVFKKMFDLVNAYCTRNQAISPKKRQLECLLATTYDRIFEDMVDYLISDTKQDGLVSKLKNHPDGKELDHIYLGSSLFEPTEKIHFIGDSKYYKVGAGIEESSVFKQFTYARNIQTLHLGKLSLGRGEPKSLNSTHTNVKYYDNITQGYNIIPNFFIRGVIYSPLSFNHDKFEFLVKESKTLSYDKEKLHDSNSFCIQSYSINYLFLLATYVNRHTSLHRATKDKIRNEIRINFVAYYDKTYSFYRREFSSLDTLQQFVKDNFYVLSGKLYRTNKHPTTLILSVLKSDGESVALFRGQQFSLTETT